MRTIIIGDIHGCSGSLRHLLAQIAPDEKSDRLILLGDLFDRGPDSWGVFKMVRELADKFGDRFVLIRGNHDDYLLTPDPSWGLLRMWEHVGRGTTVKSFEAHGEKMESSAAWIGEHAVPFWRGDGFQCVHAGLRTDPIESNDARTMIHDHYVAMENRYAGPITIVGHIALDQAVWFPGMRKQIYAISDGIWEDLPQSGVICIDTGCGKGGRLTGMVIEDGKFILHSVAEM